MPLFSRLGPYDTAALDRLLFARRAPYVEYWAHVASFIPAADWGLFRFRMDEMRAKYGTEPDGWFQTHREIVDWVRAELADRGPLRPAQIEHDAKKAARGPWWDWDVVKHALEYLWLFGEVAIAGRRGFERRYGLAEHVLPADALGAPVAARRDAIRELVARAAKAHGVGTASDLADYWRIKDRRAVMAAIERAAGLRASCVPVTVEGWTVGRVARRRRGCIAMPSLPRRVDAAAILTPFDPVVWFRDRAERLFDFEYRIEIYTPAPQRRFGYYSLPVLIGDDIVGRVDLKADRAILDSARAVGVVGARATGGCRVPPRRRAPRRRTLAGARVDLGVALGRCHRRPGGRAARGTPARQDARPRRSRRRLDEPAIEEPAGVSVDG